MGDYRTIFWVLWATRHLHSFRYIYIAASYYMYQYKFYSVSIGFWHGLPEVIIQFIDLCSFRNMDKPSLIWLPKCVFTLDLIAVGVGGGEVIGPEFSGFCICLYFHLDSASNRACIFNYMVHRNPLWDQSIRASQRTGLCLYTFNQYHLCWFCLQTISCSEKV